MKKVAVIHFMGETGIAYLVGGELKDIKWETPGVSLSSLESIEVDAPNNGISLRTSRPGKTMVFLLPNEVETIENPRTSDVVVTPIFTPILNIKKGSNEANNAIFGEGGW